LLLLGFTFWPDTVYSQPVEKSSDTIVSDVTTRLSVRDVSWP